MRWCGVGRIEKVPGPHWLADGNFCTLGDDGHVLLFGGGPWNNQAPLVLDPAPRPALAPFTPDPTAGLLLWDGEPLMVVDIDSSNPYRTRVMLEREVECHVWSWQRAVEVFVNDGGEEKLLTAAYGRLIPAGARLRRGNYVDQQYDWLPPRLATPHALDPQPCQPGGEVEPSTLFRGHLGLRQGPCWMPAHEIANDNAECADRFGWVDVVGHPGHQIMAAAVLYRPGGERNPDAYYKWPRPGASPGFDAVDLRVTFRRRFLSGKQASDRAHDVAGPST